MGATDYIVRPIRMNECRALKQKMKQRKEPQEINEDQDQLKGLDKYEKLRPLGRSSTGEVSLFTNIVNGKKYAIKEILLFNMNSKAFKAA